MPQPNLIHPVKIVLEIIDRDDSVFDPYAREPVGQVVREGESPESGEQITIKAQISYYFSSARKDAPRWERAGVVEESIGYVSMRYKDMVRAGLLTLTPAGDFDVFRLKRGDRIVKLGKEIVDFYIAGFKPFAHYPGKLMQTMLEADFTDRHPGYQQGDL
jgi:hypothetical protein